jgi:hypothetical protein
MKKMNLISDDATSRQIWRLTSDNLRTTGKLIEKNTYYEALLCTYEQPAVTSSLLGPNVPRSTLSPAPKISNVPLNTLLPAPKISNVPSALCYQNPKSQMFPSALCYQNPKSQMFPQHFVTRTPNLKCSPQHFATRTPNFKCSPQHFVTSIPNLYFPLPLRNQVSIPQTVTINLVHGF